LERIVDTIILVTHEYENSLGCECLKIVGLFRTIEEAQAAVASLRDKEGFRDHPEGFDIGPRTIGEISWASGFITWKEALDATSKT
jgi:hypothetical protein